MFSPHDTMVVSIQRQAPHYPDGGLVSPVGLERTWAYPDETVLTDPAEDALPVGRPGQRHTKA